jgi:hypothetical protein
MAAFAPKEDGGADTSKVGQMEQVDGGNSSGAGAADDDPLGLSAEEAQQFAEMESNRGAPAVDDGSGEDVADEGDDGDAGDGDAGDDGEEFQAGEAGDAGENGEDGTAKRDDKSPAPGKKSPKTVSYGRFKRETDKMQATLQQREAELAKEREERARLDERTRMLLEAINARPAQQQEQPKQEVQEEPEPDAEADPIGNLQWHNRRLAKQVNELTTGRQREQEMTAAEREERRVYSTFEADLQREAASDPEFADAFVHLRETRYRELGFIYADIDITDPAQCAMLTQEQQARLSENIQRAFHNEQMMVASEALKAKKSPAKVVKNLAIARGFSKKAPAADGGAAAAAAAAAAAGGAAPRAPKAKPAAGGEPSVSEQLEAIRKGSSERSLSDGGGSPGGQLTPARLLAMDDEEFEMMLSQNKRQIDRQLGK